MLDPVTGVSRGYGFVRFTDEADQQRALIEMHGLYCLSRPMRISPATAKFKPAPGMAGMDFSQMPFPPVTPGPGAMQEQPAQLTITLPLPSATQTKSVSAPLAGSTAASSSSASLNSATASNSGSSLSAPSLSSGSSTTLASASSEEALKAAQYGASNVSSNVTPSGSAGAPPSFPQPTEDQLMAQKFNMSEESWKHHAQARAILSNLIGPNGEQLTSSDPYNTTVFVGGLSPLISEDTLRTFFAPFGEIHYVKVPVGKHCGFVQFNQISWGRSQYKAAQAAAQAAQAAAFQAQYQAQLLEKFGLTNLLNNPTPAAPENSIGERQIANALLNDVDGDRAATFSAFAPPIFGPRTGGSTSTFSPFSPDPNYLGEGAKSQDPSASQSIPQSAKGYAPWYNAASDDRTGNASRKGFAVPGANDSSLERLSAVHIIPRRDPVPVPARSSDKPAGHPHRHVEGRGECAVADPSALSPVSVFLFLMSLICSSTTIF
ncbi:Protein NAM8 [Grifola frondosa]|uniref:Protein NAM8 n=1 Tax=Grifola frondosa TaxID=5627 RepID=A0A1C7M0M5_GRIFR|nr:Protein NAM8 [Grifola frondosa]